MTPKWIDLAIRSENAVGTEAHIVERDLVPGQPEQGEEANVGCQGVVVVDLQQRGETCQVGDEEEIVEEFGGCGFGVAVVSRILVQRAIHILVVGRVGIMGMHWLLCRLDIR